jgi:hypothetical protein
MYQYYSLSLAWWWLNEPKHVAEFLIFNIDYQYMLCHWRNIFTIRSIQDDDDDDDIAEFLIILILITNVCCVIDVLNLLYYRNIQRDVSYQSCMDRLTIHGISELASA